MSTRSNRIRVLIVDNENHVADTLAMILYRNGFVAATAYDSQLAVELANTFHPDALIIEVMLKGMNGIEVAADILQMFPRCKVILFSGHMETTNLIEDARARGQHFEILANSVAPQTFIERLSGI